MKTRELVLAGAVGIGAAAFRLVYAFFPYLSVSDIVVFGVMGFGVARRNPSDKWLSYLLVVLAAMASIGFVLFVLGPSKLREGVGAGHLRGALLVPLAAALGFLLQRRSSQASVVT